MGLVDSSSKASAGNSGDVVQGHLEMTDFLHADDTHEAGRKLVGRHDEGANWKSRGGERHGSEGVKDSRTGEMVYTDVVSAVSIRGEGGQNG